MLRKKTICLLLLSLLILVLLAGCVEPSITSIEDELKLYTWQNKDEFDKTITLSFSNTHATLLMKTKTEETKIEGLAVLEENNLQIFDSNVNNSYAFSYKLFGDKIELTYGEHTLTLYKQHS